MTEERIEEDLNEEELLIDVGKSEGGGEEKLVDDGDTEEARGGEKRNDGET